MTVMTSNHLSQALNRLTFFTRGNMKIRRILPFVIAAALIYSCDDPIAYENNDLVYNPFSVREDSLPADPNVVYGRESLDWVSHLRAIVGSTPSYKAGFTIDFNFNDSTLDIAGSDSIRLRLRHVGTYPGDASLDTLDKSYVEFGFYEMTDVPPDLEASVYGTLLGLQNMPVQATDGYWDFKLPADIIEPGDTTLHIGVFPQESDFMSFVYGGGSSLGPELAFYYHTLDTAGQDSATAPHNFVSDSVYVHLMEQPGAFETPEMVYLSQLWSDSLVFQFDLSGIDVQGDTLISIVKASLLPEVDLDASAIYLLGSADSLFLFEVTDNYSEITRSMQLGADGQYYSNEVKYFMQTSLDEEQATLELVLRPNHLGYDPGFIAIKTSPSAGSLYSLRSLAVHP